MTPLDWGADDDGGGEGATLEWEGPDKAEEEMERQLFYEEGEPFGDG